MVDEAMHMLSQSVDVVAFERIIAQQDQIAKLRDQLRTALETIQDKNEEIKMLKVDEKQRADQLQLKADALQLEVNAQVLEANAMRNTAELLQGIEVSNARQKRLKVRFGAVSVSIQTSSGDARHERLKPRFKAACVSVQTLSSRRCDAEAQTDGGTRWYQDTIRCPWADIPV